MPIQFRCEVDADPENLTDEKLAGILASAQFELRANKRAELLSKLREYFLDREGAPFLPSEILWVAESVRAALVVELASRRQEDIFARKKSRPPVSKLPDFKKRAANDTD